jgi:hypothetical protein
MYLYEAWERPRFPFCPGTEERGTMTGELRLTVPWATLVSPLGLGVDDDGVGMVARRAGVAVSLHLVVLLRSGEGGCWSWYGRKLSTGRYPGPQLGRKIRRRSSR